MFVYEEGGRPDHLAGGRAPSTVALHGALHSLKELLAALAIGGRPGVCAWRRDEVDHVLVARALRGCEQIWKGQAVRRSVPGLPRSKRREHQCGPAGMFANAVRLHTVCLSVCLRV